MSRCCPPAGKVSATLSDMARPWLEASSPTLTVAPPWLRATTDSGKATLLALVSVAE